jgi:beta-1,4-mannosyltransferase
VCLGLCHTDSRIHSLPELVTVGVNGQVFRSASELAEHLEVGLVLPVISIETDYASQTLLTSFPSSPALDSLRTTLQRALQVPTNAERHIHNHEHQDGADWEWGSWSENWNRVVKPVVLGDPERSG